MTFLSEKENNELEQHWKLLTRKRLVNSIDTDLDLENYHPLIKDDETLRYKAVLRDTENRKNIKNITFSSNQPINVGQHR